MLFTEIVKPLIDRQLPFIPLRPRTKIAFVKNWETQPCHVLEEAVQYSENCNAGVVCRSEFDGLCVLDLDNSEVLKELEKDGYTAPITYTVRTSPKSCHLYFYHTEKSIAVGNLKAKNEKGQELWSFRADRQYVVAAGSVHPDTNEEYKAVRDIPIVPIPDWLVDWLHSHSNKKKEEVVYEGGRNKALFEYGSGLRGSKVEYSDDDIAELMREKNLSCIPPLEDKEVESTIRQVLKFVSGAGVQNVQLDGRQIGTGEPIPVKVQSELATMSNSVADFVPTVACTSHPVFPRHVMEGTSIYEGFVKPVCAVNSRYPEYMFMPAMVLLLNYCAMKVKTYGKHGLPSVYLIMVGERGMTLKSASAQDSVDYFEKLGLLAQSTETTDKAEGRMVVYSAASPEGVGKVIARDRCTNILLFYDEFSTLVQKTSIEASTLSSMLCTMYESGKYQNIVKSEKDRFSLLPNSYCTSLITCDTDLGFIANWSKLQGTTTGLLDRVFFLYQPEVRDQVTSYEDVDWSGGLKKTYENIQKALAKKEYQITSPILKKKNIPEGWTNRQYHRAEKWALAFAIDLGKDTIDDDCAQRAFDLTNYEIAAKAYLVLPESASRESQIQNEMVIFLSRNGAKSNHTDFQNATGMMKYGAGQWASALEGLKRAKVIAGFSDGVGLLRMPF